MRFKAAEARIKLKELKLTLEGGKSTSPFAAQEQTIQELENAANKVEGAKNDEGAKKENAGYKNAVALERIEDLKQKLLELTTSLMALKSELSPSWD